MKDETKNELKHRLGYILQKEGLNPNRLAERIGVSHTAIYRVINGKMKPGFELIEKILNEFPNYNETWFIQGSGDPEKQKSKNVNDISFGEQIAAELMQLRNQLNIKDEQIAKKDEQIDKLLDLLGKDDLNRVPDVEGRIIELNPFEKMTA